MADLVTRAKDGIVELQWTPIPSSASYNIYRRLATTALAPIAQGYHTNFAVYIDTSVTNGTLYCYTVRWVSPGGAESADGTEACTTPTAPANRGDVPPTILSPPVTTATVGFAYVYAVRATDPNAGDTLTFSLPIAPAGMTINNATGLVQWTPITQQVGSQQVRVQVQDSRGRSAQQTFYVTVSASTGPDTTAPSLALSPLDGATVSSHQVSLQVVYSDTGSGVDTTTLKITLDSTDVTSQFTVGSSAATNQPTLAGGGHTWVVMLKDKAGNQASATGHFSVSVFQAQPDATPRTGNAPLTVTYITKGENTDGQIFHYRWDFDGDGIFDTDTPGAQNYTRTFTTVGVRNSKLEIENEKGQKTSTVIQITVSGTPPTATASVNPSNGQIPLAVTLTGSGTPGTAAITKYEWDFDGDGTWDYSSTTTGNTAHTYTVAGTYNAMFRVTDAAGLTATARATATAVRAGPPGSPSADITAPTGPQTRTAPATISFNGTGTTPSGTITKYEWDFNGDGIYEYSSTTSASTSFTFNSPGTFTVAFRVTNSIGLTGVDTVDITINIAATLTLSTDTLRPSGTLNVNTTIGGITPVTVFLKNKSGQTVKTLVNNVTRNAGSYSDPWDGTDSAGNVVPEGEYFAILQYLANGIPVFVDLTNTTGNSFYNPSWNLSTTAGGSCFDCPFAPYSNNFLQADFTVSPASEVTVSIRGFNTVNEVALIFDRRPFGRGKTYRVVWEGTNASGQLVHPSLYNDSQFIFGMTAFTLPNNGIFVEVAPEISAVSVTPNYFDPYTGDFLSPTKPPATATYTLSKTATVRLQVYGVGSNTLFRTIDKPNASSGTGTVQWDGRDDRGIFVDKGDYRLAIKAIDAAGNQSLVRYALMKVFY